MWVRMGTGHHAPSRGFGGLSCVVAGSFSTVDLTLSGGGRVGSGNRRSWGCPALPRNAEPAPFLRRVGVGALTEHPGAPGARALRAGGEAGAGNGVTAQRGVPPGVSVQPGVFEADVVENAGLGVHHAHHQRRASAGGHQVHQWEITVLSTFNALPDTRSATSSSPGTMSEDFRRRMALQEPGCQNPER